ncbi:hypothetical protein MHL31_14230 [Lutibacter sp. A80]|uniref:hypothetical protein n=1 Tax=Lutibacter sp. A80 TaxID=2918453 RepID=UPI001F05552C|nr:hypothetical protein [Lutibacter sp. A80]UMB60230.1 hypothetical protein MHL31_14230 [Lutibacter sp. A80]
MKKLVGLTVIIMFFSLTITAQGQRQNKRATYTPEQKATLQSKKLALRLDLNASQEKAVEKLMLKSAEERESYRTEHMKNKKDGTGLTSDERFEREKLRLEKQQATKAEFKKILTEEQFEKWETIKKQTMRKGNRDKGNRAKGNSKESRNNKGPKKGSRNR